MQFSPTLSQFMSQLEEGPRGPDDALAAIAKCSADKAPILDLQQMHLSDADLALLVPHLPPLAPHLKNLNLFMNEISVLPASLSVLSGLETLHVGCNPLECIEDGLFHALSKLEELDIGYSETLSELPDSFEKLQSLRVLLAGNGRLSSIPPSLFECQALEELYLYGNSLKAVGDAIGNLFNLRVLNLGRNQIKELPETIGKCSALETLHLYENCLARLPEGVAQLDKLKTINVLSNIDMPMPPREVRHLGKATATAAFLATGKVN